MHIQVHTVFTRKARAERLEYTPWFLSLTIRVTIITPGALSFAVLLSSWYNYSSTFGLDSIFITFRSTCEDSISLPKPRKKNTVTLQVRSQMTHWKRREGSNVWIIPKESPTQNYGTVLSYPELRNWRKLVNDWSEHPGFCEFLRILVNSYWLDIPRSDGVLLEWYIATHHRRGSVCSPAFVQGIRLPDRWRRRT